jgi:hypothetical protein
MATIQQIREAMHRAPFTPFVVRLVDGRSFTVEHPDFIAVPRTDRGRTLVIHDERMNLIDLLMVVSVDFAYPDVSGAPEGNGA